MIDGIEVLRLFGIAAFESRLRHLHATDGVGLPALQLVS
jgi:hypothetical protein